MSSDYNKKYFLGFVLALSAGLIWVCRMGKSHRPGNPYNISCLDLPTLVETWFLNLFMAFLKLSPERWPLCSMIYLFKSLTLDSIAPLDCW